MGERERTAGFVGEIGQKQNAEKFFLCVRNTNQTLKTSGTHRQNAPMTVIVTSPCLLQLQCNHRSTLPITDMSHCQEVILTDVQPCPR